MVVLKEGQSISHERATYPIWERVLPPENKEYTFLKLLGIDREGWITIKQGRKMTTFESNVSEFRINEFIR